MLNKLVIPVCMAHSEQHLLLPCTWSEAECRSWAHFKAPTPQTMGQKFLLKISRRDEKKIHKKTPPRTKDSYSWLDVSDLPTKFSFRHQFLNSSQCFPHSLDKGFPSPIPHHQSPISSSLLLAYLIHTN